MNVEKLKKELIRDEGFELKPYQDSVGKLTIGVGRNLTDRGISRSEARFMLANDLFGAIEDTKKLIGMEVWWQLSDARQRVLVNMCFNLGLSKLRGFRKMLIAIHDADYDQAAVEMLDSRWAVQVGVRAERLAEMMKRGV